MLCLIFISWYFSQNSKQIEFYLFASKIETTKFTQQNHHKDFWPSWFFPAISFFPSPILFHSSLTLYQKSFSFHFKPKGLCWIIVLKTQCTVRVLLWWMAINNIIFNNKIWKNFERDLIAPSLIVVAAVGGEGFMRWWRMLTLYQTSICCWTIIVQWKKILDSFYIGREREKAKIDYDDNDNFFKRYLSWPLVVFWSIYLWYEQ